MTNPSGNKKTNNRRKRRGAPQSAARQTQQRAAEAKTPAGDASAPTIVQKPVSRRTSKKEAAQAQAKKRRQMQMIIGGAVLAIVVALIFIIVNRPSDSGVQVDYSDVEVSQSGIIAAQGTPAASPEAQAGPLDFATGTTVGDPNAPVTMHIFSDFQCHFCLQFHDDTLPKIMDDFVRDGQINLVFHDFPRLGTDPSIANPDDLTIELRDPNNESSLAAQAAMCAGEQDAYLEMSDKIFGNYGGTQAGAFKRANLNRFASDLGLDKDPFNECMDSGRYIPALAQSVEQGQSQGITATPMFILDNGSGELNVIQQTEEGYTLLKKQIETSIKTAP